MFFMSLSHARSVALTKKYAVLGGLLAVPVLLAVGSQALTNPPGVPVVPEEAIRVPSSVPAGGGDAESTSPSHGADDDAPVDPTPSTPAPAPVAPAPSVPTPIPTDDDGRDDDDTDTDTDTDD